MEETSTELLIELQSFVFFCGTLAPTMTSTFFLEGEQQL